MLKGPSIDLYKEMLEKFPNLYLMASGGAVSYTHLSLWFLYRHGFHFEFTRKDIRLNRNLAKKVMTLGAPIALQDALINISFLIITVIVNQMGVIASASVSYTHLSAPVYMIMAE